MEVLFSLNLAVCVFLILWPVWFSRLQLKLSWINPFSISVAIALPFEVMKLVAGPLLLIEQGLFDEGYQFAVLMNSTLLLSQAAGAVFVFRLSGILGIHRFMPLQRIKLHAHDLQKSALFFLVSFLLAVVILANSEFGILNWLANPREGYQLHRTGQGHWYALATSCLSVAFVLLCLSKFTPTGVIGSMVLASAFGYFLGSKSILLLFFSTTLIFLWFQRFAHFGKILLLGSPLVMALLVFNLYLALGDGFEWQSIVEYFDYYKNAADYYTDFLKGNMSLFYGEVIAGSLWSYVPRFFWPEKPVIYGILLINEIYYPGMAELTNTPAFGGAVEQFADFGPLGVIMFGFFGTTALSTGLLSYLIFKLPGIQLANLTLASVVVLIVQYAPAFGFYFPGGLYFILLLVVVFVVSILRRRTTALAPKSISV